MKGKQREKELYIVGEFVIYSKNGKGISKKEFFNFVDEFIEFIEKRNWIIFSSIELCEDIEEKEENKKEK